jgi:hypothetical protein
MQLAYLFDNRVHADADPGVSPSTCQFSCIQTYWVVVYADEQAADHRWSGNSKEGALVVKAFAAEGIVVVSKPISTTIFYPKTFRGGSTASLIRICRCWQDVRDHAQGVVKN